MYSASYLYYSLNSPYSGLASCKDQLRLMLRLVRVVSELRLYPRGALPLRPPLPASISSSLATHYRLCPPTTAHLPPQAVKKKKQYIHLISGGEAPSFLFPPRLPFLSFPCAQPDHVHTCIHIYSTLLYVPKNFSTQAIRVHQHVHPMIYTFLPLRTPWDAKKKNLA